MLRAVPSNNFFSLKVVLWPDHTQSPDAIGWYELKDEDAVVEALSSLVAAASNRTQEDWAWDAAGYSRSTSKLNTTRMPQILQAWPLAPSPKPTGKQSGQETLPNRHSDDDIPYTFNVQTVW